jgi:hypothetical protein
MSIDWDTFSTDLLRMLATYLQPEKASGRRITLQMQLNQALKTAGSNSHSSVRITQAQIGSSWTCSTCGNKGHHQYMCTQPSQPSVTAAKMVLLAKEAAAAKCQDKLHPKGKRKRIQEANIQLSNNESSQPLQAEKTNLSKQAGSTDKPVTAGLARLHLLDNSHENARLEYCRMAVCYLDQDDFKGDSNSVLKLSLVCMPIYSWHHSVRKLHCTPRLLQAQSWAS